MKTYTKAEIMKALDFKVEPRPLFTEDGIRVDRNALVRPDLRRVLGVVSNRYQPLLHQECFEQAISVIDGKFGSKGYKISQLELPSHGGRLYVTIDIDTGQEIKLNDTVLPRLIMTNSFDGSLKFGFILAAVRLVCTNGLRAGKGIMEVSCRHFGISAKDIGCIVDRSVDQLTNGIIPMWRQLARTTVNTEMFVLNLQEKTNVPSKMIEHVTGGMPIEVNAWELYNAFTKFLTHEYTRSYERGLDINGQVIKTLEEAVIC